MKNKLNSSESNKNKKHIESSDSKACLDTEKVTPKFTARSTYKRVRNKRTYKKGMYRDGYVYSCKKTEIAEKD